MFYDTELTRGEILELHHILGTSNFNDPMSNQFRYMVTKCLAVTKKEVDEINDAFPPPKGLEEYRKKRNDIFVKYNITNETAYKELPEKTKKSVDVETAKLEEDNKKLLEEVEALDREKNDFLEDKVPIKLYKIKMDLMPTLAANNNYSGWDIWAVLLKSVIIEPDD